MIERRHPGLFLSRLCGGERHINGVGVGASFLSRLCGGELQRRQLQLPAIFLSRLCGGEQYWRRTNFQRCFLSRLCGGELFYIVIKPMFLKSLRQLTIKKHTFGGNHFKSLITDS